MYLCHHAHKIIEYCRQVSLVIPQNFDHLILSSHFFHLIYLFVHISAAAAHCTTGGHQANPSAQVLPARHGLPCGYYAEPPGTGHFFTHCAHSYHTQLHYMYLHHAPVPHTLTTQTIHIRLNYPLTLHTYTTYTPKPLSYTTHLHHTHAHI